MDHIFPKDAMASSDAVHQTRESRISYPSSLVTNMIHPVIRARLPRVSSIRKRLMKDSRIPVPCSGSSPQSRALTIVDPTQSGAETPPPNYQSSTLASRAHIFSGLLIQKDPNMEIICQTPSSPFSQSSSDESWKYVREGFDLLAKSAEELAPFSPKKSTNLAFARQLHLDGVGYILKSLPADLKPEEQLILQSSLPSSILADEREIQRTLPASGESPPYFQKCIKGFIIQLFLVFQYLLPYLQHFIQISLEYERSHKISERLFRASMAGLNYAITRVFEIRERVSTMSDGRAEEVVIDSVGWCFVNILGGLYNGCREGMVNLKEDRDRSRLA